MDERYNYALAAALVILEEIDLKPDLPKPERLARTVFSILHGMERYDEARPKLRELASTN